MPLAVSGTAPLSCARPRKPAQCNPEEWVRYDTTTIEADKFPEWLKKNDRAFREDPAVIAAAERAVHARMLDGPILSQENIEALGRFVDSIPPSGRSTSGRCAPAREPSDTPRDRWACEAGWLLRSYGQPYQPWRRPDPIMLYPRMKKARSWARSCGFAVRDVYDADGVKLRGARVV
jgi:hypothetical protein